MKHIAAYLLLVLGGNTAPSASDVTALLAEVGIDAEAEKIEKLVADLHEKNLDELIAEGMKKVGSVSVGGGGGGGGGAAAAGGSPSKGGAAAKVEEKVEEKEEEVDAGVGGLFGDGE
jgi:large subunit ribosomal protein LP2